MLTTRTFAATGDTTAEGQIIYRAVGPVGGRFSAALEWLEETSYSTTTRGWVLTIATVDDHGLEVNRVNYRASVRHMVEPVPGDEVSRRHRYLAPGEEVSWHVRKMGGKWDDTATSAARVKLRELFAQVLAEVATPDALWQAKVCRCQDQITALQDERAKFLAANDDAQEAAARRLSFHLDNPA